MAVFRKLLRNRKGDIIIPVVDKLRWVPDYSKAETLSLNSNGSATIASGKCGWVVYYYYGYSVNQNHELYIKVNNQNVFSQTQEAPAPNSARAIQGRCMFPVSGGDVITQSGSSAGKSAVFIPGKWA